MQAIDKLLINGRIYTLEKEGEWVEAVGIDKGVIVYTGTTAEAQAKYQGKVIDLKGKAVIPGMGDGHLHFYAYCQTLTTVDLGTCTSKKEAIEKLAAKAKETPEGEWIKGSNFDQSKWSDANDQIPFKEDLDQASTKHPIVIKRVCLHTCVGNSLALEKAGIGKGYQAGPGGTAELDENGMPNGILREQATQVFDELIPDPLLNVKVKNEIMAERQRHMSSLGLTMMHTYAADIWKYIEVPEDYEALDKAGLQTVRTSVYLDKLFDKQEITPEMRADPNRKVQVVGYKLFSDGSLGSRSAALYEPYADDPATDGIIVTPQDKLNSLTWEAYQRGLQPATHAIGDKALEMVLESIEYTLNKAKETGMDTKNRLPFRIIHAQLADDAMIARMAKLPIIIDAQPSFLITDMHWIENRLGPDRMKTGYRWQSYLDAGLMLTGSSDAPVESYDPFQGIYATVCRKDMAGWPEGGFMPQERTSVYDALCMFSKNIPYATGDQEYQGTVKVGKFADLVVLDRDMFEIEPEDILNIKVEKTYLAGKEVYSR